MLLCTRSPRSRRADGFSLMSRAKLSSSASNPRSTSSRSAGTLEEHHRTTQREFTAQVAEFNVGEFQRSHHLEWAVKGLCLPRKKCREDASSIGAHSHVCPAFRALDVSTGTGALARSLAASPLISVVVGLDLTPAMLEKAKEETNRAELEKKCTFVCAPAEKMPFGDNEFDLVTCRLAAHHWLQPEACLKEMVRVCKYGGRVGVIDIIPPLKASQAMQDRQNKLERIRDPSHVRFLPLHDLSRLLHRQGLQVVRRALGDLPIDHPYLTAYEEVSRTFKDWITISHTPEAEAALVRNALEADIRDGWDSTGFQAFLRNGELCFKHVNVVLLGEKIGMQCV